MGQRAALTSEELEQVYQGKVQGRPAREVAQEVGCSVACVRKWWQRAKRDGLRAMQPHLRGPRSRGVLAQSSEALRHTAVALKRQHPAWGPNRVRVELQQDPRFAEQRLPSRSRLAAYFKQECPECVRVRRALRPTPVSAPPRATAVHEVWQLDTQEGLPLADGTIVHICTVRDPVGAAIIASQAFDVSGSVRGRKLTWTEIRHVLRSAFAEWQTMPDSVQTDNEAVLGGQPTDPFPSRLTLWLAGLGISHRFIRPHCPTDQAQVERTHRTLANFAITPASCASLATVQAALDRERQLHNRAFPTRASDCQGAAPLVAHPELHHARRPYHRACELVLFDLQRVYQVLGRHRFERKVSKVGQVRLGDQPYSIGRCWAGLQVDVQLDDTTGEWCFWRHNDPEQADLARRPLKGLDAATLTGLLPHEEPLPTAFQLPLPWLAPALREVATPRP